jgi:hypothetical protein
MRRASLIFRVLTLDSSCSVCMLSRSLAPFIRFIDSNCSIAPRSRTLESCVRALPPSNGHCMCVIAIICTPVVRRWCMIRGRAACKQHTAAARDQATRRDQTVSLSRSPAVRSHDCGRAHCHRPSSSVVCTRAVVDREVGAQSHRREALPCCGHIDSTADGSSIRALIPCD